MGSMLAGFRWRGKATVLLLALLGLALFSTGTTKDALASVSDGFSFPLGNGSNPNSPRLSQGCHKGGHTGVDWPAPSGTRVYAVSSGWVHRRGWITGYGNSVIVRHRLPDGSTWYSLYAHLSRPAIPASGRSVKRRQHIGHVGNTGVSTGPHLHLAIYKGATLPRGYSGCGSYGTVNPIPFIQARRSLKPKSTPKRNKPSPAPRGYDTIGVYRKTDGTWFLSDVFGDPTKRAFRFGQPDDIRLAGDWNGDGIDTVGVYRPSDRAWSLSDTFGDPAKRSFTFGRTGDIPLVGDWDGNGVATVGIYRPSTRSWFLSNTFGDPATRSFTFGRTGDIPLVGDWDGNRVDTVGVYRPSTRSWFLSDAFGDPARRSFTFGRVDDIALVGNWDGR